jgi:hypothetical protein
VLHQRIRVIRVETVDMAKRKVLNHRLHDIHRELTKLKRLGPTGRKKFLKTCSKDCIIKVCECIKNVLNSKLHIKPTHLKKLNRYKQTLRTLALRSTSLGKRKQILQKGGLLGALLPAIIPAIASIIGGLVNITRSSKDG